MTLAIRRVQAWSGEIPDRPAETGKCMVTGKPSAGRVVFAKAY